MRRATLGFCDIAPTRVTAFGSVLNSDIARRARWIERVRREGRRLRGAVPTPGERAKARLGAWLAALRLQFYPTTWMAYAIGAMLWAGVSALGTAAFWLGYLVLFFLEAATVFTNELADLAADRKNRRYGPFNGGSRVLVEGRVSEAAMRAGLVVALGLALASALSLVIWTDAPALGTSLVLAVTAIAALSYTMPPIKLCYRTLGEVDVAFTHGPAVLVCGWVIMGGGVLHAAPWLAGIPLALAVLPSITLSNVPDLEADAAVGKATIAVRFGQRAAIGFAMAATAASAACAVLWPFVGAAPDFYLTVPWGAVPHAAWLLWLLARALPEQSVPRNMMSLMLASLTHVLWFIVPPFIFLMI